MKSKKLFKTLIAAVVTCLAMFSIPLFAQENLKLSDAEVASVAVLANQLHIDYAAIAKQKTKSEDVLRFAKKMAGDHKAARAEIVALVHKIKVAPRDNAVSKKIWEDAIRTKIMLRSKSDEAFNKAYIDNEIKYHKTIIDTIENILIPQAENRELHALLQNIVPPLRSHLADAKEIQNKIS